MKKKILYLCIGTASVLLGILCTFIVELLFIACGIGLLLYGLGELLHWREKKRAGAAGTWALAGMILSISFGVFILVGSRLGEFAMRLILIALSIWLIAQGMLEILGAVMYRKAMTSVDLGVQAPGSIVSIVMGSIMAAVGVLGIIFPSVAGFAAGIWIITQLLVSGIRMIWMARSAGALGEKSR